ncbi:hypothetical protein [Micromonospora ureilytica]|uniref:DUF2304 domain-containing protein n=1 Tax=Micromonospora ureilytica TaxID=709868 RepID=A0ABS0JQS9_9ACTN|nr:hypothetical protein [Micromonospora ureilytica]MBG6069389.1 hypothetical protein [Micromonospora ureilytica]
MSVSHPVFLAIVAGLLFAGALAIPSGVLAIRFRLARGIKVIGTMLLPVLGLGAGIGLLRLNPVEGEYKVGLWFLLLGILGPFAAVYDLRRVLTQRREAERDPARQADLDARMDAGGTR